MILSHSRPFLCCFGPFWGPRGYPNGPRVVQHDIKSCNIPMGSTLGRDKYPVCWMLVLTALLSHYQSDDEVYCLSLSLQKYMSTGRAFQKIFFVGTYTHNNVVNMVPQYLLNGCTVALSLSHRRWILTIIRTFLCDILPPNQYLQKAFWPNIVISFGTVPPHKYKGFTEGKIQKIHYGP